MPSDVLDQIRLNGEAPRHVALIMDGNGRWARERGLPRHAGHREGMKAVRDTVEGAVEVGLDFLTLFAFSTENWQRPAGEISALMGLLRLYAEKERRELARQGVEVCVLGELDRLDPHTRGAIDRIVEGTRGGEALRLNLMISYGGREDLVQAARSLAHRVARGELEPDAIDEELLGDALFTGAIPDPDLLIRTSGEYRLSNFLLWQLAYTELLTTSVLWPDFRREHLFSAILEYQRRDRRFGRVPTG